MAAPGVGALAAHAPLPDGRVVALVQLLEEWPGTREDALHLGAGAGHTE